MTSTPTKTRTWDESLSAVMDFVAATGRYPVSGRDRAENRLKSWLFNQSRLTNGDRIRVLDEKLPGWRGIGNYRTWDESLALTAAYVAAHGKNPAQTDPDKDVVRLASWLKAQRLNATAEAAAILDATIPGWRGTHPGHRNWEESFTLLRAFVSGNDRLPKKSGGEEGRLGNWIDDQRRRASAGQRARLDAEFPGWDAPVFPFDARLEEVKAFHAATGRLPRMCDTGDARALAQWVSAQRQYASPVRRAALESLFPGWCITLEEQWETTLAGYVAFIEANGCRPRNRSGDADEVSLARWMFKQRRNATGDRASRLDAAVPGWRLPARRPRS